MRRVFIFLAFLVSALIALVAVIVVGLFLFDTSPSGIIQGMTGMMGGGGTGATQNGGLIIAVAVLIGVIVASLIGFFYFWYRPEIKKSGSVVKTPVEPLHQHVLDFQSVAKPYELVVKGLT